VRCGAPLEKHEYLLFGVSALLILSFFFFSLLFPRCLNRYLGMLPVGSYCVRKSLRDPNPNAYSILFRAGPAHHKKVRMFPYQDTLVLVNDAEDMPPTYVSWQQLLTLFRLKAPMAQEIGSLPCF
jgi:hypothetical protein